MWMRMISSKLDSARKPSAGARSGAKLRGQPSTMLHDGLVRFDADALDDVVAGDLAQRRDLFADRRPKRPAW